MSSLRFLQNWVSFGIKEQMADILSMREWMVIDGEYETADALAVKAMEEWQEAAEKEIIWEATISMRHIEPWNPFLIFLYFEECCIGEIRWDNTNLKWKFHQLEECY